ncbi:MAG: excinuclease ABC subunit UvrB [Clostridiales Family XIII bacterium]|nr:excinuclease ABC subunit UvrB [Clostridiales Family XIII bacterium]
MTGDFKLVSPFSMMGDQVDAVDKLINGVHTGKKYQTLLGATGSGKTFTMANVIEKINKPTLVISHNKTLAAQLCGEFKEFFPDNAVEYFVSYYDYYQPEAYVPSTDTYIDKDSQINDEIDRLRHSATAALSERNDVLIVASVSCIYGLGSPIDYEEKVLSLRPGMVKSRDDILRKLVDNQYSRNDIGFDRGNFRVRGDVVDIFPAGAETAVRVELFGDEVERIVGLNPLTGEILNKMQHIAIFPASHYVTSKEGMERAVNSIEAELEERLAEFKSQNKLLEMQRLEQRTRYDIEMLREIGICKGIENYSRHLVGLEPGIRPYTLIDYFPDDFLLMIDESHVMLPQLRAMYAGDRSRKSSLVDYGFRLPSALDNRPLQFEEFEKVTGQTIYVSATPSAFEIDQSGGISAEQVIRPTGLLDPIVEVRPATGQVDDLISEIRRVTAGNEEARALLDAAMKTAMEAGEEASTFVPEGRRVLITTLTKKMAESLTDYLDAAGIKVRYMHSDIVALERMEILRDLRRGDFDVLVGINLLREGLDIPEVSLVTILDADKQGFLRNYTSLIQTIGRAARNAEGRVIMYADAISPAMQMAIDETARRREVQIAYNKANGITPTTIRKTIRDVIEITSDADTDDIIGEGLNKNEMTRKELAAYIKKLEKEMKEAAAQLEFERAAMLRDRLLELRA